jgi:hypothetical protein
MDSVHLNEGCKILGECMAVYILNLTNFLEKLRVAKTVKNHFLF